MLPFSVMGRICLGSKTLLKSRLFPVSIASIVIFQQEPFIFLNHVFLTPSDRDKADRSTFSFPKMSVKIALECMVSVTRLDFQGAKLARP